MKIGVVSVGFGNVNAIVQALNCLGEESSIVEKPDELAKVNFVIIPGVGSFPRAISCLEQTHIAESLKNHVKLGKPLLGICLGFQLLFANSLEGVNSPGSKGLGFFPGTINLISSSGTAKTGWFETSYKNAPNKKNYYYFNHRYGIKEACAANVVSFCADSTVAEIRKDNIYGVQFHPEKSQSAGVHYLEQVIKEWT